MHVFLKFFSVSWGLSVQCCRTAGLFWSFLTDFGKKKMFNPSVFVQDNGVVIAEVQADRDGHGITVENHESLDIYQSTKQIQISGTGFKEGTKVHPPPSACRRSI